MLCLKKVYSDELLQLTLILSLLRVSPNSYFDTDPYIINSYDHGNGTSWRLHTPTVTRSHYIHPKSLDNILINYQREVFSDLNSLGRYNRINNIHNLNVTAYLLNSVDCELNAECNLNVTEAQTEREAAATPPERAESEASEAGPPDIETVMPSSPVIDLSQEVLLFLLCITCVLFKIKRRSCCCKLR